MWKVVDIVYSNVLSWLACQKIHSSCLFPAFTHLWWYLWMRRSTTSVSWSPCWKFSSKQVPISINCHIIAAFLTFISIIGLPLKRTREVCIKIQCLHFQVCLVAGIAYISLQRAAIQLWLITIMGTRVFVVWFWGLFVIHTLFSLWFSVWWAGYSKLYQFFGQAFIFGLFADCTFEFFML